MSEDPLRVLSLLSIYMYYIPAMIPIHHMEAHALTPRLTNNLEFPYLAFLISGGHCMLALAQVNFTIAKKKVLKWFQQFYYL